jgi:hypothetical protein
MSFWTDPKVIDAFTPEDKYFYLYLMTNPHTNLCGCYEISERQIENETGYTRKTIEKLMDRMCQVHKVIVYSKDTKEVLIVNWHKYNWTSSVKFRVPLEKEIQNVKNVDFKAFLDDLFNGIDTVSIPYLYGSDTTVTVTDTVTVSNNNKKNIYGEYKHVRLTDKQYDKLVADYGDQETKDAIKFLDEYIQMKGYKSVDHNLAIRKWVFDAVQRERQKKTPDKQKKNSFSLGKNQRDYGSDFWEEANKGDV